jgi:hypothetical protein
MANEIKLKIRVDDDGNLKVVGKSAEKAAKGLDQTGRAAQTADRRLKGAAKASANGTKNFSKLAQGISGGLVPAYATLAAQIFAISAAFNFLKAAGDLKSLQEGQIAYASSTGVAMRTLTQDIIDATDAQVSFQDAAAAGAIGTAAGLSTSQITSLGKAAKDASIILGRDVTDSFNRLVRGVTKAEPELLDELGIILRLEQASKDYARTLGVNAKDLTQFQKSQAVANDVLSQAESKYGRIIEIVNPGVNKFNQLGKAFDDIVNNIKTLAVDLATPLANLFIDVPQLAYAGFLLIGKGVLSAAIPALSELGDSLAEVAEKSSKSFEAAQADVDAYQRAVKAAAADPTAARELKKQAQSSAKASLAAAGITKGRKNSGLANILGDKETTTRQLASMKKAATSGAKTYEGMSRKIRRDFVRALDDMIVAQQAAERKMVIQTQTTTQKMALGWKKLGATARGVLASTTAFAVTAGNVISRAFFWLQILGTVFVAGKLAYDFFAKSNEETEKTITASSMLGDRLKGLNKDYENLVEVQKVLLEDAPNSLNFFKTLGNVVNSLTSKELTLLTEQLEAVANTSFAESIKKAESDFSDFSKKVEEFNTKTESAPVYTPFGGSSAAIGNSLQLTKALQDQKQAQEVLNSSLLDFIMTSEDSTEAQKSAAQFIQTQIDLLTEGKNSFLSTSKSGEAYLNSLNKIAAGGKVSIEVLLAQKDAVAELGASIAELERVQKDNKDQFSDFVLSFAGESRESRILKNIQKEKDAINKLLGEGVGDEDGAQSARLEKLAGQEALATTILDKQFKIKEDTLKLQVASIKLARGVTKGQADRLKIDQKIKQNAIEQRAVELNISSIRQAAREDNNRALNEDEKRALEINTQKLNLLKEQTTELARQLDVAVELEQTFKNSFERGFSSGLADLIKGNESSLRDSIAALATTVLDSIADVISKRITDSVVDLLFPVQKPADKIKQAHVEGAQVISDAIVGAHNASVGSIKAGSVKVSESGTVSTGVGSGLGTEASDTRGILERLLGSKTVGKVTSEGAGGVFAESEITRRTGGVFSGFINAFSDVFNKNVDGGFITKLGAVFQEGGSLFGQLFEGIVGIFSGGGGGGFLTTLIGGFLGMANGGYATGGFRAFANGGTVNKPTLGLVGEGKYNEAIVPLPDGKSIPVMMKGSQSSNVVVNVHIDKNGNSMQDGTSDNAQGMNLGNAIASAVQKEMQNQKRSGGILNPYGVA